MALLSDATIIIEAGEVSGTRSQGWEALRLDRPLFILEANVRAGSECSGVTLNEFCIRILIGPHDLTDNSR